MFSYLVSDDVATTIAAQLATLPILLSVFGNYGLFSVMVNALVLWTIPILMFLGGIGALIGIMIPLAGKLFLFACLPFLLFFEAIIRFFGGFGLMLTISSLPAVFIISYYLFLTGIVVLLRRKPEKEKI